MPISAYCSSDKIIERISVSPDEVSRETSSTGHAWRVKSRGESMYPLIKNGDTLLIEPLKADELHPGDIAFYRVSSGSFVAHRFIKRNSSGLLLTNGDSLRQYDELVDEGQVFGKVIQIEHNGKALKLAGRLNNLNTRLITWLARYRVPLQITLKKTLGRVQCLAGQRRLA
jgi:signal peptidase I